MSLTDYAKEIVKMAQQSDHHVCWAFIVDLPAKVTTMNRLVTHVSNSGCKVKTHGDKFVVIDLSWI